MSHYKTIKKWHRFSSNLLNGQYRKKLCAIKSYFRKIFAKDSLILQSFFFILLFKLATKPPFGAIG